MKNNVKIIAEAGVNHNGSIKIAKKLIDEAKLANADFIKFQYYTTNNIVIKTSKLASYQKKNVNKNILTQYNLLKKYEFNKNQIKELIKYAKFKKINIFFSIFDLESLNFLKKLNIKFIKIPSGEIDNAPLLEAIGSLKKQIIMSTGMSELAEIKYALKILITSGTPKKNITVLHCNTEYPSPINDINMKAMVNIKKKLGVDIGYSDHSNSIEVPIVAVALGAKVIEKHFTLNKKLSGPDHKASLSPKELKSMILNIKNTEKILGSELKKITKSEMKNKSVVRKSIVALQNIKKGEKFTKKNLTLKRPGTGISPKEYYKLIGKISKKNFYVNEQITDD